MSHSLNRNDTSAGPLRKMTSQKKLVGIRGLPLSYTASTALTRKLEAMGL